MTELPYLEQLTESVHNEVLHDDAVKQSIQEGYMNEQELLIARYVNNYCDLNTPEHTTEEEWRVSVPAGCYVASKKFHVTVERANELFEMSLDIRHRIMQREQK